MVHLACSKCKMSQRNVEVAARVGIPNSQEAIVQAIPECAIIALPDTHVEFDFAFNSSHNQECVYDVTTSNLIENLFQGFNATVITYGQTNTGKTFTIFGSGVGGDGSWSHTGLVAFCARDICDRLEKLVPKRNISLCVSYYEIQNEEIHDLLTSATSCNVYFQADEMGTLVISGLTEIECTSMEQILCCLETGLRLRSQQSDTSFGSTLARRSHMVFTIQLKQRWIEGDTYIESTSRISFVDLAGSERLGSNLEGAGYNSGLLALNSVITALGDPRRKAHHTPYWDSKLTCVLKNALGGDSLTLFICCLSPHYEDVEETLNTLHIGVCARNIVNTVVNHTVVRPVYEAYESERAAMNSNPGFRPTYRNPYPPADRFFIPITPVPEESVVYSVMSDEYTQSVVQQDRQERPTQGPLILSESKLGEKLERSEDTSLQDQLFRLQFAVSQMLVLIRSAQDLLSDLSSDDELSLEYRNRAEAWLCLKQECEECLAPDLGYGSGSIDHLSVSDEVEAKSLEVIEEVSEPTATHSTATTNQKQEDSVADLAERLKIIRSQFRLATDKLIWSFDDSRDLLLQVLREKDGEKDQESSDAEEEGEEVAPVPRRPLPAPKRRQSIFQGMIGEGSEASNPGLVMEQLKERLGEEEFEDAMKNLCGDGLPTTSLAASEPLPSVTMSEPSLKKRTMSERRRSSSESATDEELRGRVVENQLRHEVRELSASTESKKVQVRQANWDMKSVKRMLKELKSTIEVKQALLADLERAEEQSEIAQKKFERRIEKLEHHVAEYKERIKKEQEKLRIWEESGKGSEGEDETVEEVEKKIEKLQRKIEEDEKRLRDLENLRCLLERDPGRIEDLRRSLSAMRQKHEELLNQLELESERKRKLEDELFMDNQKIRELEKMLEVQQCSNQAVRLRLSRNDDTMETPSPFCSAQSETGKNSIFMQQTQSVASAMREELKNKESRILELERKLKECNSSSRLSLTKSVQTDCGDREPRRGQDEVRHEIRKLRKVRDSLMVCKQHLDEIRHLDRQLDPSEERRWLEYDEAIEAVDWAIEYKNQIICENDVMENRLEDFTSDESLLARLNQLSLVEIRRLFTKYFRKVVDLREGCRKLEQQVVELEDRLKEQTIEYRKMHDKLQRTRFDAECRLVAQQRDYELQVAALVQQLGEDSSGSSAAERRLRHMESEVEHLRKENRMLKANLSDLMLRIGAAKEPQQPQEAPGLVPEPSTSSQRGPFSLLPVLHGFRNKPAKNTVTTQVTRQKNKLIIEEKNKDQRRYEKK